MADNAFTLWCCLHWHVVLGCTPISDGCKHCWAAFEAFRLARTPTGKSYIGLTRFSDQRGACWTGEVRFRPERLHEPDKVSGRNIWVAPMSDPFHEKLTDEQIASIFAAIARNPQNTFQLLTKRPERMEKLCSGPWLHPAVEQILGAAVSWPLPNIWAGVSVEDQWAAEARIPHLLNTPSPSRFLSFQPLLEASRVRRFLPHINFAVIGAEAGPASRPVEQRAIIAMQTQLNDAQVPYVTSCAKPLWRR